MRSDKQGNVEGSRNEIFEMNNSKEGKTGYVFLNIESSTSLQSNFSSMTALDWQVDISSVLKLLIT